MKKGLMGVLTVTALLISGCGKSTDNKAMDDYVTNDGYKIVQSETADDSKVTTATETKAGTPVISKEKLKIGVLYIGKTSEASGYTYTHELGILGMINNLGLSDNQVIRKESINDSDANAIDKALKECIDEGCNIIFATSWGYMDLVEKYAKEYPDVYFAHGTGYKSNAKNFTNYFGRIYQARYLSGIVAGLKTKTNKIGYVAAQGKDNSEVTGGIDAFAIGVESVNKEAKIYVEVTNSWYDPDGEKAKAEDLLDKGCDVLAQHCDTTAPQEAAQKKGVWSIGYNSDMSKETPKATLTSVVWTWSAFYTSYVQSIMDGSYDGSDYYDGMKVGLVGLSDLADFNDSQAASKVEEAKAKLLSGEYGVFDGVLETNDGKQIGSDGSTLDDATIKGSINWYYRNVIVEK